MGVIDGSWDRRRSAAIVGERRTVEELLLELRSGGAIVGIEIMGKLLLV